MAELLIVAVKDTCTGEVLSPTYVHNHDEAKRIFAYQMENTKLWKNNAEQFLLLDLGMLDTLTGNIIGNDEPGSIKDTPIIHPEIICKGTDIVQKGE